MREEKTQAETAREAQADGNFLFAHRFTAKWEGGLSDHPDDGGGLTAYGVSLEFAKGLAGNPADLAFLRSIGVSPLPPCRATIKALRREQAQKMFKREFWQKLKLGTLPRVSAALVYDAAVNCGPARSVKLAQRGVNRHGSANLACDGILGPRTRQALAAPTPELVSAIIQCRREFYHSLAVSRPSQKAFLQGWLNRANDLEKLLLATF